MWQHFASQFIQSNVLLGPDKLMCLQISHQGPVCVYLLQPRGLIPAIHSVSIAIKFHLITIFPALRVVGSEIISQLPLWATVKHQTRTIDITSKGKKMKKRKNMQEILLKVLKRLKKSTRSVVRYW